MNLKLVSRRVWFRCCCCIAFSALRFYILLCHFSLSFGFGISIQHHSRLCRTKKKKKEKTIPYAFTRCDETNILSPAQKTHTHTLHARTFAQDDNIKILSHIQVISIELIYSLIWFHFGDFIARKNYLFYIPNLSVFLCSSLHFAYLSLLLKLTFICFCVF